MSVSPYIIGTMRQSTSNSTSSADLQLTHHNFRWVLFTVHAEPVRGLLARQLRRRCAAEAADRPDPRRDADDHEDALERLVNWLPKVWNHVNRFLEAHCFTDVTIGSYSESVHKCCPTSQTGPNNFLSITCSVPEFVFLLTLCYLTSWDTQRGDGGIYTPKGIF